MRAGILTLRALTSAATLGVIATTAGAPATPLASRTLLLDAALAGDAVVAVGERGVILRSVDHARSWKTAASPTAATLTGVAFADADTGWAVGHDGLILATHDGGRTWAKQWQSADLQDSFLDIVALDARHTIAVGAYGLYVSTADGGETWARRKITGGDYHFNRIVVGRDLPIPPSACRGRGNAVVAGEAQTAGSGDPALHAGHAQTAEDPARHLFIAGEHGTLLRSSDVGASWQPLHVPYEGSLYGVLVLQPHALLAYGLRGRVFQSDDDGARWTPVSTNETWLIATGLQLREGSIVLAGNGRTLLTSREPRRSFAPRDIGLPSAIAELIGLSDGEILAVGEAGAERIDVARIFPAPSPNLEPRLQPRNDTQ